MHLSLIIAESDGLLESVADNPAYILYSVIGLVVLMFLIGGITYFVISKVRNRPPKPVANSNESASEYALKLRTKYAQERDR